ncbi:MAG: T9SS type A sorting domain-containing protein [Bacteroidetes bacterium]|nr:T9SS type A sorting domain-containing protein [Bacteroidota bacterium]
MVYPNPAKNRIFIEIFEKSKSGSKFELNLRDITSRIIVTETKDHGGDFKFELDITNLKSGFYFLSIKDDSNVTETHKIIIEN